MIAAAGSGSTSAQDILLNLGLPGVLLLTGAVVIRYLYQQRESAWSGERGNLLAAITRADDRTREAEVSRDKAIDSLKEFMKIAQTETAGALRESQAVLSEAMTRERILVDRIGGLERELDIVRRQK